MKNKTDKSEKTLLTAFLLSAPGPLFTGYAAFTSLSTTQISDFMRRLAELIALFTAYWVYRKIQRDKNIDEAKKSRMEQITDLCVGGVLCFSGLIILLVASLRFFISSPSGNVTMGLVIAILGLLTNSYFFFTYRSLANKDHDPIIISQAKLYSAKACIDFAVVFALSALTIAPESPYVKYIDILGSLVVAVYILHKGILTLVKHRNLRNA